ncbi:eukaryotic translation initiation factor 5A [Xylariomycetidae sp. FL2044]|nr:eukaryotic translation initiation factor 5A [Xylariomycetidae sp. FL2044]
MADDSKHEHTFEHEGADAGASATHPVQCSALRKGDPVVIKGRPCKIVEMSTSKTGKHGHAKVHLVAIDIFTKKKLEELCPSTHNMDVPEVRRKQYTCDYVTDDGFLHLLEADGSEKLDFKAGDDELSQKVRDLTDEGNLVAVTLQSALGIEGIDKVDIEKE